MFLIEEKLSLIEVAREYIHAFLSEFGEFLPFALIMQGNEIIPLEHEGNDQSSTPEYLIDLYESYFNKEREDNKEYQLGLLCIDIFTHSNKQNDKRNGIEYRLFGTNYTKKVIQYYDILKDKTISFHEMIGWDFEEMEISNETDR